MSLTGKHRLRSFPLSPFPRPHCFSHFLCRSPPACRPSFTAHGKGSSSSPVELSPKRRERKGNTLFLFTVVSPSLPLRWSCARVLCLGEVSASQSQVHFSLKCDVYLPGPVNRTAQVSIALVRSLCDPDRELKLGRKKKQTKNNNLW